MEGLLLYKYATDNGSWLLQKKQPYQRKTYTSIRVDQATIQYCMFWIFIYLITKCFYFTDIIQSSIDGSSKTESAVSWKNQISKSQSKFISSFVWINSTLDSLGKRGSQITLNSSLHITSFNLERSTTEFGNCLSLEQSLMFIISNSLNMPISWGNFRRLKQLHRSRIFNLESSRVESGNSEKSVHDLSLNTLKHFKIPKLSGRAHKLWQCVILSFFRLSIRQIASGRFIRSLQ